MSVLIFVYTSNMDQKSRERRSKEQIGNGNKSINAYKYETY